MVFEIRQTYSASMTQIYITVDMNINVANKTSMNSSIHHDQIFSKPSLCQRICESCLNMYNYN